MDEQVRGMTETEREGEREERLLWSTTEEEEQRMRVEQRLSLRRFDVAALSSELGGISHGFSQDSMFSL